MVPGRGVRGARVRAGLSRDRAGPGPARGSNIGIRVLDDHCVFAAVAVDVQS
jgi:hypothetical protein